MACSLARFGDSSLLALPNAYIWAGLDRQLRRGPFRCFVPLWRGELPSEPDWRVRGYSKRAQFQLQEHLKPFQAIVRPRLCATCGFVRPLRRAVASPGRQDLQNTVVELVRDYQVLLMRSRSALGLSLRRDHSKPPIHSGSWRRRDVTGGLLQTFEPFGMCRLSAGFSVASRSACTGARARPSVEPS